MRLHTLSVKHYKSLADVGLPELRPITLLVGPNASGKSNVIDCLRFLRDSLVEGLEHAISKRGGIELIRQYSPTKPYQISFELHFIDDAFADLIQVDGSYNGPLSRYELSLQSLVAGNYRIEHESCDWFETDQFIDEDGDIAEGDTHSKRFERNANGVVSVDGDPIDRSGLREDMFALGLGVFTPDIQGELGEPIAKFLSRMRFSAIYPNTLREPMRPDTDRALKENGENWASVIRAMKKTKTGRAALDRIQEVTQVLMPNFQEVVVNSVGGFLVPTFRVKDSRKANVHEFDASQLSDGTLRVFGMLLALYQSPAPPLMAIEEPEQTINPGLLATLAEVFREVSGKTQLFITTHSPFLVDHFEPENLRVVAMSEGLTKVNPVKKTQVEAAKEGLMTLGEFMSAEGLLAEQ
jgi:predicted ATPase